MIDFDINVLDIIHDLRNYWENNRIINKNAFKKIKTTGNDLMFCCPFHEEDKPSFGISVQYPYLYNCFSCGETGNIVDLIMYVRDCSYINAVNYLSRNYILVSRDRRRQINIESVLDRKDNTIDYEQEIKRYKNKKHIYMSNRGITDKTLIKFEVGYDEDANSIVFPVRDSKGRVRFLQRRGVNKKVFLNSSNVIKKDIIYGLYYILTANKKFDELYLVESIIDCLSLYESRLPAGAIMGCILFKEQVYELMKAGIKTINLMLDNDDAGREGVERAYKLITSISPIKVNVVLYPEGNYKDANDLLLAGKLNAIKIIPYEQFKI